MSKVINNYCCFIKYHDLKCDIYVAISFDSPNDFLEFFSKYNPCSIDILECHIIYDRDEDENA